MSGKMKRVVAIGMTILISAAYICGCGAELDMTGGSSAEDELTEELTKAVHSIVHVESEATEPGKEETVYTLADANGNPKETVVSAWLKNPEKKETLNDYTTLKNIENVMGFETFTDEGNGQITWQADGSDIYYEGTTDKELPVTVKLTYKLDGKEIDPSELKGKSGHLTTEFSYTNNVSSMKEVEGKQVKIYEPFLVISGLGFENEKAENITVSNGQLIDLEDSTLAFGFALPGLAESLGIEQDPQTGEKPLPDSLTIEADVKNYSPVSTVTMIDNNLLRELQFDGLDSFEGIKAAVNKLYSSSQMIADGSVKLNDGITRLAEKTPTLNEAVGMLESGSEELFNGSETMGYEAGLIQAGLATLSEETSGLYEGADIVSQGAYSLYEGANAANEGSATLSAGLTELAADIGALPDVIALLHSDILNVRRALKNKKDECLYSKASRINDGAVAVEEDAAVMAQGAESISAGAGSISESASALKENMGSMGESLLELVTLLQDYPDLYTQIAPYFEDYQTKLQTADEVLTQIQTDADMIALEAKSDDSELPGLYETAGVAGLEAAAMEADAAAMKEDINTLVNDENLGAVSEGLKTVYEDSVGLNLGVNTLSAGADLLQSSTADVKDSASVIAEGAQGVSDSAATIALESGTLEVTGADLIENSLGMYIGTGILSTVLDKLHDGTETLASGSQLLSEGAAKLKDGMGRFHQEGIERISKLVLEGGANLVGRVKALKDMADEYTTYAGNGTTAGDKVSFIIRTESGDE